MTVRQVAEEYGIPQRTAQTIVDAIDRQGRAVRFDGIRRVFVDQRDVDAGFQNMPGGAG